MARLSIGVEVSRRIARQEARDSGHRESTTLHLFIGICSLEKVLALERPQEYGLSAADVDAIRLEWAVISDLLEACGVTASGLRRAARGRVIASAGSEWPVSDPGESSELLAIIARAREAATINRSRVDVMLLLLFTAAASDWVHERLIEKAPSDVQSLVLKIRADGSKTSHPLRPLSGPLAELGVDLTSLAAEGKVQPCVGRRDELLQIIRTLSRATKNNPLLVGDPGVGKSAIVEGLAWRIAHGKSLPGKRIVQINMGDLIAGTQWRGDFEKRVQELIEAARNPDIILFIDEIHTIVSAGHVRGGVDAANLLKPPLARGELRCIGATTYDEYRKYFEKDPALERRFQPIFIQEPTTDETLAMLRDVYVPRLSERHRVQIDDSAVTAAVDLSVRYLLERRLPDKAIDILDEACVRMAVPMLSAHEAAPSQTAPTVTAREVAAVVAVLAKVPVADLQQDEKQRLLGMADALKRRVVGQERACESIASAIQRARVGIRRPNRPVGVFLLIGPTGVGKTELAKSTAELLFGSADSLIRLDMSEFHDRFTISRLIGAPPGYVGHDQEGLLTGALRRQPFSVVLIDEIDKAHPDVARVFLQLFDEGRLTDSKGNTVDGSNSIFMLTANVEERVRTAVVGFGAAEPAARAAAMQRVGTLFPPELINRLDEVIVFEPLTRDHVRRIAMQMIDSLSSRMHAQGIRIQISDRALDHLCDRGFDPNFGARPLRRLIEQHLETEIAARLLRDQLRSGQTLWVDADNSALRFETTAAEP